MKVTKEQLVSSDIIGEEFGAIIDLNFTKVVDGDLVKVLSWYDNELGYARTLVEHARAIKAQLWLQICYLEFNLRLCFI